MSGRAAALLERQGAALGEACAIPFVRQVTDGTLSDVDLGRYLLVEEDFVLTAARVLGRVVWGSTTWAELLPHARSLTNLVTDQRDYFAGLRGRFPVDPAHALAVRSRARVLADVVLAQVEDGGRAAGVVGMYAAETMYARWCAAAASAAAATRQPELQAWLLLHTDQAFLDQVDALRAEVDALGAEVTDADLDRWFTGVLTAEVEFHAAAMTSGATTGPSG